MSGFLLRKEMSVLIISCNGKNVLGLVLLRTWITIGIRKQNNILFRASETYVHT